MSDDLLMKKIQSVLSNMEETGDIVVCSHVADAPAKKIYDTVKEVLPSDELSPSEISGIRTLIHEALNDPRFFDWEMPTLTGLSADEFRVLANKLPKV